MLAENIRTERLILRPFLPSDVDGVLAYALDPEWSRYTMALPDAPYARADAESFLAKQATLDREVHPSWAIEFQGLAVGGVNVRFSYEDRIGEIGYGLAQRLWGRGLVVEAVRTVLSAAFDMYPQLGRIRARTDSRNTRSLRVLDKLGMRREALLRSDRFFRGALVDEVICGILRSEWAS